eukprot:Rhum_TRINITY_DN14529_c5_g1::Rhum_TRINITY_DN14529_c5_g1_i1::g.96823::m.96823
MQYADAASAAAAGTGGGASELKAVVLLLLLSCEGWAAADLLSSHLALLANLGLCFVDDVMADARVTAAVGCSATSERRLFAGLCALPAVDALVACQSAAESSTAAAAAGATASSSKKKKSKKASAAAAAAAASCDGSAATVAALMRAAPLAATHPRDGALSSAAVKDFAEVSVCLAGGVAEVFGAVTAASASASLASAAAAAAAAAAAPAPAAALPSGRSAVLSYFLSIAGAGLWVSEALTFAVAATADAEAAAEAHAARGGGGDAAASASAGRHEKKKGAKKAAAAAASEASGDDGAAAAAEAAAAADAADAAALLDSAAAPDAAGLARLLDAAAAAGTVDAAAEKLSELLWTLLSHALRSDRAAAAAAEQRLCVDVEPVSRHHGVLAAHKGTAALLVASRCAAHPHGERAVDTLLAAAPAKMMPLFHRYYRWQEQQRSAAGAADPVHPTAALLAKCCSYLLPSTEEVPQAHTIYAIDLLALWASLPASPSADTTTSSEVSARVAQRVAPVVTGLGKYGTCRLPEGFSPTGVRADVLRVVARALEAAGSEAVSVPADPKFYKKLCGFLAAPDGADVDPTLRIVRALCAASKAGREASKVADAVLQPVIALWEGLEAAGVGGDDAASLGALCFDVVADLSGRVAAGRATAMAHRAVLRPLLAASAAASDARAAALLEAFAAEDVAEAAAREAAEAEAREAARVRQAEEEREAAAAEARRAEMAARQQEQEARQRALEEEVREKLEAERRAREAEERARREKEAELTRQAQREERARRQKEEAAGREREKLRVEAEKVVMEARDTVARLTAVGVPLARARMAIEECHGHDEDTLLEWVVQTRGDPEVEARLREIQAEKEQLSTIQITGSGKVKRIERVPAAKPAGAKPRVAPKAVMKVAGGGEAEGGLVEGGDEDDDGYQDFWVTDVDLTKNLHATVEEATPESDDEGCDVEPEGLCDDAGNETTFVLRQHEEDEEAAQERENPGFQEDFRLKFQSRMEKHEAAHPKSAARRAMPPWHRQLAYALDLLDMEANRPVHVSDAKFFLQKDLGIRGTHHHSGHASVRAYLESAAEAGVLRLSKRDGQDLVSLTRFGKRYHERYWDEATSVRLRKPVEDALRAERKENRKRQAAEARRRALDALLAMRVGGGGGGGDDEAEEEDEEIDPEEIEIPDWVLEEEMAAEEGLKGGGKPTPEEAERLREHAMEKRVARLEKMLKNMEAAGKPVVRRLRAGGRKAGAAAAAASGAPSLSAGEIAEKNREAAEERAAVRRREENEARQREAEATKAGKLAMQKRGKKPEVYWTPRRKFYAFCVAFTLFMVWLVMLA